MDRMYDFLLQLMFLGIGIYILISTYKRPAPADWFSTNIRGYLAGISFLILGILSLIGKYSILLVLRSWYK